MVSMSTFSLSMFKGGDNSPPVLMVDPLKKLAAPQETAFGAY